MTPIERAREARSRMTDERYAHRLRSRGWAVAAPPGMEDAPAAIRTDLETAAAMTHILAVAEKDANRAAAWRAINDKVMDLLSDLKTEVGA